LITPLAENKERQIIRRGYVAFFLCGLCVALNELAYLPSQTFVETEATEFTVTFALLILFVASAIAGTVYTFRHPRDSGLVTLFLVTLGFVASSYFRGSYSLHARVILDISYAVLVCAATVFAILRSRHSTTA